MKRFVTMKIAGGFLGGAIVEISQTCFLNDELPPNMFSE